MTYKLFITLLILGAIWLIAFITTQAEWAADGFLLTIGASLMLAFLLVFEKDEDEE